MRFLRDIREVAELWLCGRFIPAFHCVFGWPHIAKAKFNAILKDKTLLPAGAVGRQGLYVFDVLAGDDKYNFLSAIGKAVGMGDPACYGFIFDAEQLIYEGALIGKTDLLSSYERVARQVAKENGFDHDTVYTMGHSHATTESLRAFINYKAGGGWGERERGKSLELCIPQMIEAFRAVQAANRLSGHGAMDYLHQYASKVCGRMRLAVERSVDFIQTEEFARLLRPESPYHTYDRRDPSTACKIILRDNFYHTDADRSLLTWDTMAAPELLWRGRLPLSKAVAVFDLGCVVHGYLKGALDWPDSIFTTLCPGRTA